MPNYDFICANCHKSFSETIAYKDYGQRPVVCPHCGGSQVRRRIGRVRVARSNSARIRQFSELADPQQLDSLEKNPHELGRRMRKLSQEIGEDVGAQFNEVVDRLEQGQSTEEIENSMPDYTQLNNGQEQD